MDDNTVLQHLALLTESWNPPLRHCRWKKFCVNCITIKWSNFGKKIQALSSLVWSVICNPTNMNCSGTASSKIRILTFTLSLSLLKKRWIYWKNCPLKVSVFGSFKVSWEALCLLSFGLKQSIAIIASDRAVWSTYGKDFWQKSRRTFWSQKYTNRVLLAQRKHV